MFKQKVLEIFADLALYSNTFKGFALSLLKPELIGVIAAIILAYILETNYVPYLCGAFCTQTLEKATYTYGVLEILVWVYLLQALRARTLLRISCAIFMGQFIYGIFGREQHDHIQILLDTLGLYRSYRSLQKIKSDRDIPQKQIDNPQKLRDFVPFAQQNIQDPYPFYKALRDEAPCFRMPNGNYYVISRYKDIVEAAKRTEDLSSNLVAILLGQDAQSGTMISKPQYDIGPVDVLALADPPIHTKQRKIAFAGLTPKLFAGLETKIRDLAISMLDEILQEKDCSRVEWMDEFALRLPMIVALDLVGFPTDDHRQIKEWADHGVALLAGINTPKEFSVHVMESMKLYKWIQERLDFILESDEPIHSPFLAELVKSVKDNTKSAFKLTRREAASMILQILLAGNDSSASTLGFTLFFLGNDVKMQDFLKCNSERIADFVEEVLRLESPFGGHFRKIKNKEGITVHGKYLPYDTRVMLLWASGNRDERRWEKPDELLLDRMNKRSHLSFGHGIHSCLGQNLARLEVRVVLEEILRRTSNIKILTDKPQYVESVFVRSLKFMDVEFNTKPSEKTC